MSVIEFIGNVLKFLTVLFTEYLRSRDENLKAQNESKKQQLEFDDIARNALQVMRERNREERRKLSEMQDRMDEESKKGS